jgi:hypothetical protein
VTSVRRALAPVDAALLRFRNSLTPGQRWTAVGALALALALMGFGSPEHLVFEKGPRGRNQRAAARPVSASGEVTAPESANRGSSTPSSGAAPVVQPASSSPSLPASSPTLVALVAGDKDAPRGDGAMAQTFVDARHLDATLVAIDDADACAQVQRTGAEVALASLAVPADLQSCLSGAGITLVTHDHGFSSGVVATRWGIDRTLTELGRWGRTDPLRGRVGVVATGEMKPSVERVMRRWAGLGIDVESVVYVGGAEGSSEADAVRSLASHGVEVVVLAVPVEMQRHVVGLGTVLLGSARYVVADAFDAVWDESYAPVFDGAVGYTTARGAWFGRVHGTTSKQTGCRSTWEAAATPGVMLGSETLRVYAWCAVSELAARALSAGVGAISAQIYESPLTSDLVVEDGDTFGPGEWAVVVWRSSCGCWTEREPFTNRSSGG